MELKKKYQILSTVESVQKASQVQSSRTMQWKSGIIVNDLFFYDWGCRPVTVATFVGRCVVPEIIVINDCHFKTILHHWYNDNLIA